MAFLLYLGNKNFCDTDFEGRREAGGVKAVARSTLVYYIKSNRFAIISSCFEWGEIQVSIKYVILRNSH